MSRFLKWIVNTILLVAILTTCALLIPPLAGVTTIIVDDVDMETNLDRGSATYGMPKHFTELEAGDDVIVSDENGNYVYRLKSLDTQSGSAELEDIKSTDGQTKTEVFNGEIPKVILTVPFIGYVVMAMKSTEGLIIIGLGVIFVIILFILSELWKKDKDEDEEDEDDEEAVPVDMSAHILEKVSSEIGAEISNVVAQDTDQSEALGAVAPSAEEANTNDDTKPIIKEEKTTDEKEEVVKAEEAKEVEQVAPTKETTETEKVEDKPAEKESRVAIEAVNEKSDKEAIDKVAAELAKAVELQAKETLDKQPKEDAVAAEFAKEIPVEEETAKEEPAEGEVEEPEAEEPQVVEEAETVEEEPEDLEPVEMAMPAHTAAELLQKAKEAGHEPEVKRDDETGITILDYSNIL